MMRRIQIKECVNGQGELQQEGCMFRSVEVEGTSGILGGYASWNAWTIQTVHLILHTPFHSGYSYLNRGSQKMTDPKIKTELQTK